MREIRITVDDEVFEELEEEKEEEDLTWREYIKRSEISN